MTHHSFNTGNVTHFNVMPSKESFRTSVYINSEKEPEIFQALIDQEPYQRSNFIRNCMRTYLKKTEKPIHQFTVADMEPPDAPRATDPIVDTPEETEPAEAPAPESQPSQPDSKGAGVNPLMELITQLMIENE